MDKNIKNHKHKLKQKIAKHSKKLDHYDRMRRNLFVSLIVFLFIIITAVSSGLPWSIGFTIMLIAIGIFVLFLLIHKYYAHKLE